MNLSVRFNKTMKNDENFNQSFTQKSSKTTLEVGDNSVNDLKSS